jgi:hypothetical protein
VPSRRGKQSGPTIDLLTKDEVSGLLRVSPRTGDRLVKLDRAIRSHRRDVVEPVNRRTIR